MGVSGNPAYKNYKYQKHVPTLFRVHQKHVPTLFRVHQKHVPTVFRAGCFSNLLKCHALVVLIRRISGGAHGALGRSLLVLVFSYVRWMRHRVGVPLWSPCVGSHLVIS